MKPSTRLQLARPQYLVIGVDNTLKELKRAINQPELPHIDLDALLEHVVDAVHHRQTADWELRAMPARLMTQEVLCSKHVHSPRPYSGSLHSDSYYEELWESVLGLELIASCASKMGHALKRTLDADRLFEQGYLQFEYHGILDDTSLILRGRRR